MVASGVALLGDAAPWPQHCARVLSDGPPVLSAAECERIRYGLTDLLDDLTHVVDAGERAVIAAAAWWWAGEATLSLNHRWRGSGKWVLRELRDLDAAVAARWLTAQGNPDAVGAYAADLLAEHGGPLFEGYRAEGERP